MSGQWMADDGRQVYSLDEIAASKYTLGDELFGGKGDHASFQVSICSDGG